MNEFEIRKGLIIDRPWISLILGGQKDWEMRSSATSHRGWFGLIWKGMSSIYGVARLVDVGQALDCDEMLDAFDHHRIPEHMIRSGSVAKWNTPWILADVIRLPKPVSYKHPSGAVTWVNLDEKVSAAISNQISLPKSRISAQGISADADFAVDSSSPPRWKPIGESVVTQGNLDHNHIYLRSFFDRFPEDAVGGSNKANRAARNITIRWDGGPIIVTDLDGSKKFFRSRGWIRSFFAHHDVVAGDKVIVEEGNPFEYRIAHQKTS